jgi:hypothetical protein
MPVILGTPFNYVTSNLALDLNAGNTTSYSGSGNTWTDLSTSQVNATLGSTVTYTSPYFTFNGANTVVTTTDWPTWNGQTHSVESWVYPTSTLSQQGVIFEKGPSVSTQYNLGFENNGSFFYNIWGLTGSAGTSLFMPCAGNITLNAWNHIVCTYSSGTKTIYVNGVQKAQATGLSGVIPSSPAGYNGSSIGAYGGPTGARGYYFTGRLSILRLYSSALSSTDVTQNFNAYANTFGLSGGAITTTADGVLVNGVLQPGPATDLGPCIAVQSFTSTGTYTAPAGTTRVMVQVLGGGGGSAGYGESGGGGGFAEGIFPMTAGTSVTVTIGGGGGGVAYYAVAGQGGTSSFGSYLSATGGQGANQYIQHGGGAGGLGAGGQTNLYGGTGTGHMNGGSHAQSGCGGYSYYGGGGSINRHNPSGAASYSMAIGAGATGNEGNDGSQGTGGPGGMVIVYSYK